MKHLYYFSGPRNYSMAVPFDEKTNNIGMESLVITKATFIETERENHGLTDLLEGLEKPASSLRTDLSEFTKNIATQAREAFSGARKEFSKTAPGMMLAGYLARDDVKETLGKTSSELATLFSELRSNIQNGALSLDKEYNLKSRMKDTISGIIPYANQLSEDVYRKVADTVAINYDKLGDPLQNNSLVQSLMKNFDSHIRLKITLNDGSSGIIPGPDYRMFFSEMGNISKESELVGKEILGVSKSGKPVYAVTPVTSKN
jgi:hypothetical protein